MKIGLEVHVALSNVQTKLFCSCRNAVPKEPNSNACDVCLGFPGSKPRLNEAAIDSALLVCLALNCRPAKRMLFDRKVYFYPDLAKNYQITQYDHPLGEAGWVELAGKRIDITRIHMEEDPGRLVHLSGENAPEGADSSYSLIDYNRSGIPLCEIVTEPVISSPKEARLFLEHLSNMLEYLQVYDSTREGALRVDANISTHSERVEIKNITSFRDVERALSYEAVRQANLKRMRRPVMRETRGWLPSSGTTRSLRSKEEEDDYGYIVDTDLSVISLPAKKVAAARRLLPEFAHAKAARYVKQYRVGRELADSIVSDYDLAMAFEYVVGRIDSRLAADMFAGIIKKSLNFLSLRYKQSRLGKEAILELAKLVSSKKITKHTAEHILRDMVSKEVDLSKLVKSHSAVSATGQLGEIVKAVLEKNAQAIIDYKAGRSSAFHFLVGQVMRETRGRADPESIRRLLKKRIG